MRMALYAILLLVSSSVCLIFTGSDSTALSSDASCEVVEIIFARGSGENLNGREAFPFIKNIKDRLASGSIEIHSYELGTEKQGSYQYPAKAIWGS